MFVVIPENCESLVGFRTSARRIRHGDRIFCQLNFTKQHFGVLCIQYSRFAFENPRGVSIMLSISDRDGVIKSCVQKGAVSKTHAREPG